MSDMFSVSIVVDAAKHDVAALALIEKEFPDFVIGDHYCE